MTPLMIAAIAVLSAEEPDLQPPAAEPAQPQAAPAAQPPAAPAVPAKATAGGTPVKEVVVVSGPSPKVVSSFPAEGAQVAAGVLVLKVVFDQPMAPDAWSFGPAESLALPSCLERPRLLADKRTNVLLCSVAAHTSYAVQINPTPQFTGADGRAAVPRILHFATGEVSVRSLHDALSQADLTDADDPVMRWRDSGAGVSHSAPAN